MLFSFYKFLVFSHSFYGLVGFFKLLFFLSYRPISSPFVYLQLSLISPCATLILCCMCGEGKEDV